MIFNTNPLKFIECVVKTKVKPVKLKVNFVFIGPTESFKVEASLTNPSSAPSAISSSNPQFLEPDPVLPKAEQPWLSPTPAQPQPASMASMVVPSQPSMGMATSVSPSTISASI